MDDKDSECEETDSVSSVMDNPNKRPKNCEEGKDQVNVLPEKILLKIFGYLSNTDLNAAKLVCKKWRMIGETETLWSQLPLSDNNGNMEESDIDSILSKDTLPVEDFNVSIEESDEGDNEVESESGCEGEGTEDEDKHVPVGEGDEDEDISNFCDWCKKPVPLGQIMGIYEENVCKSCVDNSDLYMNTEGEWQFNHGEIEEYESSESENESSEPEK